MIEDINILKSYEEVDPYVELVRQGADAERHALGFLPPNAYRQAAEQGKLLVAVNAVGIYLGHLMFGGVFPHGKVMQIYCVPEYREHGVAQVLMDQLIDYTQNRGFLSLSAKVASDLANGNAFYERMRFLVVSTLPGGKTRNRLIYLRVRDLNTPSLFDFLMPGINDQLPTFGISGRYGVKTPIYAIDLNVLFDVSKQRMRSEDAGKIFKAGFRNDIRPVIAEEFIDELRRNSDELHNDPHLQLALQMNTLPAPKSTEIMGIEEKLAAIVFPERHALGILTIQDKSDLKHLATAIHYKIRGFITSEKAILRARDRLESEYELDVLGVSDFSDAMSAGNDNVNYDLMAYADKTELTSGSLTTVNIDRARSFLINQHVPPETIENALSKGDQVSPQKHIAICDETNLISFASWNVSQNPRKLASVFLCADEQSAVAMTIIDHTLSQICKVVSSGAPARLRLHILPGQPLTRKIALAHGFRPEPGKEEYGTILHKIAVGSVIDEESWTKIRQALKSLADVDLPNNMPAYEAPDQRLSIKAAHGQEEAIPLEELETLLSPSLILLSGRPGAIAPIRRVFADELLGTAIQGSFLATPEAALLKERVFYSTIRNSSILAPGTPILFYESSKNGGRSCVVALGRATDAHTFSVENINSDMRRRGVLKSDGFKHIGKSEAKLATTFDNVMVFNRPVSLARLREIGCADGANFVTAKRIEPHHLKIIINEGLRNG